MNLKGLKIVILITPVIGVFIISAEILHIPTST